jgi:hypothetical protein
MIRTSRMLGAALPLVLLLGATPVSSDTPSPRPVIESTSSGLLTFSREEKAIRVAAVFAAKDSAVVPTLVRFLDQRGNVLKQVRGDLSEDNAVVAELTREDVAGLGDLLVRVEVHHKLPGVRRQTYPIIVSTQPIGAGGSGSLAIFWPGGTCGNPSPSGTVVVPRVQTQGEPIRPGTQVMCDVLDFTAL